MTRAVVVISNVRLCGPLLMFGIGLLVNVQAAPNGKPDGQESETEPGKPGGVGVTTASKVATPPAITLAADGGAIATEKSLTIADCGADEVWNPVPRTERVALFVIFVPLGAVVGAVTLTVTLDARVLLAEEVAIVPGMVHTTVPPLPDPEQVAPVTVPSVTLDPKLSVNTTPLTGSPRL